MNDPELEFYPLAFLARIGRPLLRLVAILLIPVSIWGIREGLEGRNRSLFVIIGRAGPVQEVQQGDAVRYTLPFTVEETGEELTLMLPNNSAVLDQLITEPPTHTIALQYWPDTMGVRALNLLQIGVEPIEVRMPQPGIALGTSILGLLVALAILLPDLLARFVFRTGRRTPRPLPEENTPDD
jgi:hypothetical protein